MATMYPVDIELIECTESEKNFYYALKEQLPDRINVFFSVKWYSQKDGKRINSESDFLIFDPDFGYITVEVKGGKSVKVDGNEWVLVLNDHEERRLKRSPFDQAEESMRFFKKYYYEQYSQHFNGVYGYACAFPFYNVEEDMGPSAPKDLFIDHSDMTSLNDKINRVFHYWGAVRRGRSFLVQETIKKFTNMINRKINISIISGAFLQQQERRLYVLNQIQNNYLDFIENYNQAFIVGGAGTGKTWMGLKKAKRLAANEKRILFLSFNSDLNEFISNQLKEYDKIDCSTFWQICSKLINKQKFTELSKHRDLPGVFDHLLELNSLPKYDAIIVDEAQDFSEEWAMSTRLFLKDDKNSCLYVFYDSDQNIFNRQFNNGFLIDSPPFLLRENLRNTAAIFKWVKTNTSYGQHTRLNNINGVDPEYYSFRRRKDVVQRLENIVKNLVQKENVPLKSITILSNRKLENSVLSSTTELGPFSIKPNRNEITPVSVLFRTVQSFKGLESDVIIYINHTNGDELDDRNMPLDYVAYTRAKFLLYVIEYVGND
jgi:thymidine kinase